MTNAFSIENLQVRFDGEVVLDIEKLSIATGAVTSLSGPNGAGKTTLLRVLAGLLRPERGHVVYMGDSVVWGGGGASHRQRVTLLHQDPFMFRGSVMANVAYGEKVRGASWESAESGARAALDLSGCAHLVERGARELSGGERKRVAMARALAAGAETFLLDEPAAGVDAENTERLREVIAALADKEKTIILSTHQPEWAAHFAEHRISIAYGKIDSLG